MSYGFQAINQSGYVQIDQDYSNFALYTSGSATTGTVVIVGIDLAECLVFIRLPSNKWASTDGGASFGDRFVIVPEYGAANFTYEYRVYRYSLAFSPSTGYSLQVFRDDGSLCFDGNRDQTRIVSSNNYTLGSGLVTFASVGFNPWILANALDFVEVQGVPPSFQSWWFYLGARVNADLTVSVNSIQTKITGGVISVPANTGTTNILLAQ